MGKPNSFMFCRMHDMKGAVLKNENGEFTLLSAFMPKVIEHFASLHPEFSQQDALLAISGLIAFDDAEQKKYVTQMAAFSYDLRKALDAVINTGAELVNTVNSDLPSERSGIYVEAFCCAMYYGKADPDMRNAVCSLLDRVLQMEEEGINVIDDLTVWSGLAYIVDFESWHDKTYGSPIIGDSPFRNKDATGNTVQRTNSGGGCYVASAVYGSYDCPEVWTLRRYRDYCLAKSWYGRLFIYVYYAISPKIVDLCGDTLWFKRFWRSKLDKMVKRLQDEGTESTYYVDEQW